MDHVAERDITAEAVASYSNCRLVKIWERLRVLTMLVEEEMQRRMDDEKEPSQNKPRRAR